MQIQDEIERLKQHTKLLENENHRIIFKRGMLAAAALLIANKEFPHGEGAALDAWALIEKNIDRIALEKFPD